jgi:FixJ family two-component response regulator
VFVVDDDEGVRNSLRFLLKSVGLTTRALASAGEFLEAYRQNQPGCLVLDVRMPGMSGIELQQQLNLRGATIPVIFITGHGDIPMAVEAMKNGALDFIQKPFDEIALLQTVERLLAAASASFARQRQSADREALLAALTHRETQVLERIVAGRLNKQIADDLDISVKTVEAHRANLMKKLDADNAADLFRIVLGSQEPLA